jgi:restriction system protein
MTIPDFQSLMLPLMKYIADGREHSLRETIESLADEFDLTQDERTELLPSGQQSAFDNRVGWARTYMKKAGLLQSPRRGFFQITDRGIEILREGPPEINIAFLRRFPEFVAFQRPQKEKADAETPLTVNETQTPEEDIETAYQKVRASVSLD